ncbi:hypothetical protein O1L52_23395 [Pseudomonas aeruginosa]|uniref:hypothetical protein n=1 Tax=Pseudomonas aeruginosa TaxID=287 RepID=UPI002FEE664E|nr:hypothetical protein [Pseudomonas aeruginosa]
MAKTNAQRQREKRQRQREAGIPERKLPSPPAIDAAFERLQDITPNQCIAEGAWREKDKELGRGQEAIAAFADLWRSTGGDWDANPWVWVIEFKRVTP